MYYILNTKTDQNYDLIEDKFFASNWEPQREDDKEGLQHMIDSNPEKFEDCIVTS